MGGVGSCLKPRATKHGSMLSVTKRRHVTADELARRTRKRLAASDHNRSFTTVRAELGEESLSDSKLSERSEPGANRRYRVVVAAQREGSESGCEIFERANSEEGLEIEVEDGEAGDVGGVLEMGGGGVDDDDMAICVEIPGIAPYFDRGDGFVEAGDVVEEADVDVEGLTDSRKLRKRSVVLTKAAMFDYRDAEARLDDEELVKSGLEPKDVLPPRPDELIDQPISDVSSLSSTVGRQHK